MKKIIALAVASAFVAPVWAADVTLSGDIEMQWISEDGEGLATANNDGDITVNATEELANGLTVSAKVSVEDVQTAAGAGDVELHISGSFGQLSLGEVDSAAQSVDERDPASDLFGEAGVGSIAVPGAVAPINTIRYTLPTLVNGLTAMASAGHLAVTDDQNPDNEVVVTSYAAQYTAGGLTVAAGVLEADSQAYDATYVGASYVMGSLTFSAERTSNDGADNQDTQTIGVRYNLGDTAVYAQSDETETAAGASTTDSIVGLSHSIGGGLSVRVENLSSDTVNNDATGVAVIYAF